MEIFITNLNNNSKLCHFTILNFGDSYRSLTKLHEPRRSDREVSNTDISENAIKSFKESSHRVLHVPQS